MYVSYRVLEIKGETGCESDDGHERLKVTEDEAFALACSSLPGKGTDRGRNLRVDSTRHSLIDGPGI